MIFLFGFAFLAGVITIIAPCIWPLLPLILTTSATGKSHKKPLGITLGIVVSFSLVTLFISYAIKLFHFDPNILRLLAVLVIAFLGLSFLIPKLSSVIEYFLSRFSGLFGMPKKGGNDFAGGFVTGLSLGVVWTPCAGPILATIATLSSLGMVNLTVVFIMFFYAMGVGVPLFLFSVAGQTIAARTRFISRHVGRFQQVFGIIMLLSAAAIYRNYDTYLSLQLLNAFPVLNTAVNGFENNPLVSRQLDILKGKSAAFTPTLLDNFGLFNANNPAPDFIGGTKWLNTPKDITLANLRGKVVLVDFWTYTCINCLRTLPHVTAWYDTYKDDGFVVIGVHSPEFQFEHDTNNVLAAINRYNIHYPVVQDNNLAIWNNFQNQYWPAEYLIDAKGNIRRTHFGEGEYDQTQKAIETLIKEAGNKVISSTSSLADQTPHTSISPETYLGASRMEYYYPDGSLGLGEKTFSLNTSPSLNSFSLGGVWNIQDEQAIAENNANLAYHFSADKVYLVLVPAVQGQASAVKVYLDAKLIDPLSAGSDVKNGILSVDADRLYNLVDLRGKTGDHLLHLEFDTPGTKVYAFTFG